MNKSVTSQISSVLDNIIQSEFALWLDDFLQERVGKYYWNDYVKKAFSSLEWQSHWDNLKDLDNWALCKVVFKCKDLFRNSDDFSIYNKIKDLYNLRNRSKHNTAVNTSKISETDLYGLVDFLDKIEASQDSIEKIKKIIDSNRFATNTFNHSHSDQSIGGKMVNNTFEQTIKNIDRWKRKKKEAQQYCREHGYQFNMKFCNLASESKDRKGEYWLNPNPENLENDWDIILNNAQNQCFHILHIPANTFTMEDFHIRNTGRPDLYIDMGSFIERNSKVNFKPYLVKTIEY